MTARIAFLCALIAFSPIAAAPAPRSGVREHVGVSLVEVPVTVLDAEAKPVRDLRASDFEVFDDGTEVTIESVDVNEFGSATRAAGPLPTAPPVNPVARRRFVLLFDLSFITASELERSRQAARRFVNERLGPADLAAVAALSTKTVAEFLQDFSPDRTVLSKAIDGLRGRNQFFRPNGAVSAEAEGGRRSRYTGEEIETMRRQGRDEDVRNTDYLVRGLGAIGGALAAVEGRKQIILFSRGFDAASDPLILSKLDQALEELRRDDCVVHTVDVAGVASLSDRLAGSQSGAAENEVLTDIARATGGEFLTNSNDYSEQLGHVLEATSVVYVLSFHPTLTGRPGARHRLEVRTRRRGLRLFARPAYVEPRAL